ncbi:MAG: DUF1853 family protein [Aureispira sp.]
MPLLQQYQGFLQQPDLWQQHPTPPYPAFITNQPTPLHATQLHLWQVQMPPRLVLGKRAEYFLYYYLQQQQDISILTHNLQIIEQKRTIGELDFLYYNKQEQQSYHLEQVYKFYIYCPSAEQQDLEAWIGPNKKDSLVQKLDKLRSRQFPLLHHPATQATLQQQGIDTSHIQPQLSFKAALFTPWPTTFPSHSTLNPACWQGHWITWFAFVQKKWTGDHFFVPDKKDWGMNPASNTTWWDMSTAFPILEQWLHQKKAPLCWVKTKRGIYLSIFVVWWS